MGPLQDIKILDLTWVLSGPFATMTLGDLGAEVIKLERPPYGDIARTTGPHVNGESCYFFSINRGKQSISIDLKAERGRELFLQLVEQVDVVAQNYTPGVMDGLGLGWEVLSARNPRLIYACISGFGQTGPDRRRPALDVVVQGMGGVMSITGEPGGPPVRPGLSLGDIAAGLYTAVGVLAALHERETSGLGQLLDISMLDCQIAILENAFIRYFATGETPKPLGTRHPSATPFQAFPTLDGYIVLALSWGVENQWSLFCASIGATELIDDPRFETSGLRTQNHTALEPILNAALRRRTTDQWLTEFAQFNLPCGPLNSIPQAAVYPQVEARDMLVDVLHPVIGSLRMPNTPVKLSRTPGSVRGPSPSLGEHTDAVLSRFLGLQSADLAALRDQGVIL
ncbi:MAG: CaiB/BaiF CoA transferase family protein [Dehalococcoidia bacterium]